MIKPKRNIGTAVITVLANKVCVTIDGGLQK